MLMTKNQLSIVIRKALNEQQIIQPQEDVFDSAMEETSLEGIKEEVLYNLALMKIPHSIEDVANHLKAIKSYVGEVHSGPDHHIATVAISDLSKRDIRRIKKIGNFFGKGSITNIQNGYVLLIETIQEGGYIRFAALSEKIYGVPSGKYGGPLHLPDNIDVPGLSVFA